MWIRKVNKLLRKKETVTMTHPEQAHKIVKFAKTGCTSVRFTNGNAPYV